MDEKHTLESQILKILELLYVKGRFEYEFDFIMKESAFPRRENTEGFFFYLYIIVDVDRYLPNSINYDPNYVNNLKEINTIRKEIPIYLSEPNLVIDIDYKWDEEKIEKINKQFNEITREVLTNFYNKNKDRFNRSNINSVEYAMSMFNFKIYPTMDEFNGNLSMEVYSNYSLCTMVSIVGFIETYVKPILNKYGYRDIYVLNNLCLDW